MWGKREARAEAENTLRPEDLGLGSQKMDYLHSTEQFINVRERKREGERGKWGWGKSEWKQKTGSWEVWLDSNLDSWKFTAHTLQTRKRHLVTALLGCTITQWQFSIAFYKSATILCWTYCPSFKLWMSKSVINNGFLCASLGKFNLVC